jgi:antitoxin MazE
MRTKVQKWGNSLGVRIPKSLAADAHVAAGVSVEMTVEDGRLILEPVEKQACKLSDLLRRITPENQHGSLDFGPPRGKEVW